MLQPPDPEGFRQWNRNKSTKLVDKLMSEDEAIEKCVKSGDYIGFELYGTVRCPISLTRALVRSGKNDFRVVGQGVHELDLLFATDRVESVDFTYIGLEVYGVDANARRAVESGRVKRIAEWSNAAITWRFKAAAMGVPFVPSKSMLGTDTIRRSGAKVIECPFTGEKVALIPALHLDVGFIHVSRADKYGNCQIDGISGFAAEMARASRHVVVSAEEIVDIDDIRRAPDRTIIPYYLVDAVVHAPFGSWPGEMAGFYERDEEHYKMYVEKQKTEEGMNEYLQEWLFELPNHGALLEKIGKERMDHLRVGGGAA
jgi:acyl CoA:acetate/3-ketoacid CoA transferase alpha subunit